MEDSCTRVDPHLSALELLNRAAVNVQPLSELNPQFFIPRLEDKPQNPIMDTLRIMKHDHVPSSPPAVALLPPELQALSEETLKFAQVRRETISSLWELAASRDRGTSVSARRLCLLQATENSHLESCTLLGCITPFL